MKVKKSNRNSRIMIYPIDHIPLFKHCSDSLGAVDENTFKKEVIPVLQAHGIDLITYENIL